jgi:subtilisin family serine protease
MRLAHGVLIGLALWPVLACARAEASPDVVPGRVVVRFAPGVSPGTRGSLRRAWGARLERTTIDPAHQVLKLPAGADMSARLRALRRDPRVSYAEPDYVMRAESVPNDPRFAEQWALGAVDAPAAWDETTGSDSVSVGVVDTGVAYDDPDLSPNVWRNRGETGDGREHNGVDDDGDGVVDDVYPHDLVDGDYQPLDPNGHGTMVAGIIAAATNNALGIAGVAWHAKIVPLRALGADGSGDSAGVAAAFALAGRMHLPIVNASLGGPPSQVMADAIENAPDTLFVVAAGNDGESVDDWEPTYPCAYAFANLLCVGASDRQGQLATFSNYGDASVDLLAPGVDVLSTQPARRTVFADDFETPLGGRWQSGGTGDRWGISTMWSQSPSHSLADSPDGNAGLNVRSWIDTEPLDFTGMGACATDFALENRAANQTYDYLEALTPGHAPQYEDDLWRRGSGPAHVELPQLDGQAGAQLRIDFATNDTDGDGIYLDDLSISCVDPSLPAAAYGTMSGTSFSAPLVAGTAALRRAMHPDESVAMTKAAILEGVTPRSELADKVASGGILNVPGALDAQPVLPVGPQPGTITSLAAGTDCCELAGAPRVMSDGSILFNTYAGVRRLMPDGSVSNVPVDGQDGTPIALPGDAYAFADFYGNQIKEVDAGGTTRVIAGTGQPGGAGDGGPATAAQLQAPVDLQRGWDGSLYFDTRSTTGPGDLLRRIGTDGVITTVAGQHPTDTWTDGTPADQLLLDDYDLAAISEHGDPILFHNDALWTLGADDRVHLLAGKPFKPGYSGDGGPATAARIAPDFVAVKPGAGMLLAETTGRVRLIDEAGRIWTVAGSAQEGYRGDGGPALAARLDDASGVDWLPGGGFVFGDGDNNRLRAVDALTLPPDEPTATPTPSPTPTATPTSSPVATPTVAPPADILPSPQPVSLPPTPATAPLLPTVSHPAAHTRTRVAVTTHLRGHHRSRTLIIALATGDRIDMTCRGRDCPFRARRYPAGAHRRIRLGHLDGHLELSVTIRAHNGARERVRIRLRAGGPIHRTQACALASDPHWQRC